MPSSDATDRSQHGTGASQDATGSARTRGIRSDAVRSRERILGTAIETLARDSRLSMAQIADASGLTRATVYAHFPSREALIVAVVDRSIDDVADAIAACDLDSRRPSDAIDVFVESTWAATARYRALGPLIAATMDRAAIDERRAPLVAPVLRLISRGQADGEFASQQSSRWLAYVLDGILLAAVLAARDGYIDEATSVASVRETVRAVVGAPMTRPR